MERIAIMLMERDGLDADYAMQVVLDVYKMIIQALQHDDQEEAERILQEELGLDPDYIWDFI